MCRVPYEVLASDYIASRKQVDELKKEIEFLKEKIKLLHICLQQSVATNSEAKVSGDKIIKKYKQALDNLTDR